MKKCVTKILISLTMLVLQNQITQAQEIGANFNHDPEIIDIGYLKKTPLEWVRSTPYIFEYINGQKDAKTEPGLQRLIDTRRAGYKIAFGFRWDFKKFNLNIPQPGTATEKKYFDVVTQLLTRMGGSISMLKLGNEPNLETKDEDLAVNAKGYVPLVNFMQRLLDVAVLPFYKTHPQFKKPDIYLGSLPALFEDRQQKTPGVVGLIKMAQNNKNIKGLSVHLHIGDTLQIDQALKFVRGIMPSKPIIVPEFSLFRLYNKHLTDSLGDSADGRAFASQYGYKPSMKLYEWYSIANSKKISASEWEGMFNTRKWFYPHALETFYRYFKQYNVVLATYGFFSQSAPVHVTPDSPIWFVNPIFACKTLQPHADGSCMENPLWYNDFVDIINKGKITRKALKN